MNTQKRENTKKELLESIRKIDPTVENLDNRTKKELCKTLEQVKKYYTFNSVPVTNTELNKEINILPNNKMNTSSFNNIIRDKKNKPLPQRPQRPNKRRNKPQPPRPQFNFPPPPPIFDEPDTPFNDFPTLPPPPNFDETERVKFSVNFRVGKAKERRLTREFDINKNATEEETTKAVEQRIVNYFNTFEMRPIEAYEDISGDDGDSTNIQVGSVRVSKGNQRITGNIGNMELNHALFNKCCLDIKSNNEKIKDGVACVPHFIMKHYKGVKGCIKFLKHFNGPNIKKSYKVDELCDILDKFKMPYECRDINLRIYKKLINVKKKMKTFLFLVSNNHIYTLEKRERHALLTTKGDKIIINKVEYVEDIDEFIKDHVTTDQIKGFKLTLAETEPTEEEKEMNEGHGKEDAEIFYKFDRVVVDETLYINDETLVRCYEETKKIIGDFPVGLNFHIYDPFIYLCNKHKLESTFINDMNKSSVISYNNPEVKSNVESDYMAIDKNKCFASALYNLEFLPTFNSSTPSIPFDNKLSKELEKLKEKCRYEGIECKELIKYNHSKRIKDTNLYFVSEILNNPYNNLYHGWMFGYRLRKQLNNVKITAYRVPILTANPFKELITELFKTMPEDQVKQILVQFIGVLGISEKSPFFAYSNLTKSEDEASTYNHSIKTKSGLYVEEKFIMPSVQNNYGLRPIHSMIVDYAMNDLMNKIDELKKLDNEMQVRSIKTDCIQFLSKSILYNQLNLNKNDFLAWKKEDIKNNSFKNMESKIDNSMYKKAFTPNKSIKFEDVEDWEDLILNKNLFFNSLAGVGKTFHIKNILTEILEHHNKSYIVLASQHSAVTDFYEEEKPSDVIQKYTLNQTNKQLVNEFREYDYIVVDESGKLEMEHIEFIYKNLGANPNTKMCWLGDHRQMLPFCAQKDGSSQLIYHEVQSMFNIEIVMNKNMRNDYTVEDYYNMMDLKYKLTDFEKNMIDKKGDFNICITRKKMNEVNEQIIKDKKWVDTFGDIKVKVGGRLIAEFQKTTNKRGTKGGVREKKDKEIDSIKWFKDNKMYNSMFYEIVSYDESEITLTDKKDNIYIVPLSVFKNRFNYAYALTLFRCQGLSISHERIGIHEYNKIKKNGRWLYTCLSRIKTKFYENDNKDYKWKPTKKKIEKIEKNDIDDLDFL
jgi:hypothetical protein